MSYLIGLIYALHILVSFFLIIVVLLQSGKSGDIAAAFGGMGSQTAFGPRGAATALSKATTWSAVLFMVTSTTLSIFAVRRSSTPASSGSVLSGVKPSTTNSQPAAPAPQPSSPASQPAPAKYGFILIFSRSESSRAEDFLFAGRPAWSTKIL